MPVPEMHTRGLPPIHRADYNWLIFHISIVACRGVTVAAKLGLNPPVALLNNLGLLELDEGRAKVALALFEEAFDLEKSTLGENSVGTMRVSLSGNAAGTSVLEVLADNIVRAQRSLASSVLH
jgi:hypothetical protein